MNKIKSLLLAVLAVIALSSCNNEIDPVIDGSGENVTGYITLNISSPQLKTAVGDGATEGTAVGDEAKINSVHIVLVDGDDKIVDSGSATIESGSTTTTPIKLNVGTYNVYALINKPDAVALTNGEKITQVVKDASFDDIKSGYANGNFFMVNESNLDTENVAPTVTITKDNTLQKPANVAINVDRVSAKITAKISDSFSLGDVTTAASFITGLEVKGYALLNVNKDMNVFQKWGKYNGAEGEKELVALTTDVLLTPLASRAENGEGKTNVGAQFHNNIHHYTQQVTDENGTYFTGKIEEVDLLKFTDNVGTPSYITENRPRITLNGTNPTSFEDETTGVIYQVQVDGEKTFYKYKDKVSDEITDFTVVEYPELDGKDLSNLGTYSLRDLGFKVYEDGIMYYNYYIKGTNKAAGHEYNDKIYYGIFRNSIYNLNLTKINRIGDDVPGGGNVDPENPGPPIDASEAYIEVEVTVNPWVDNNLDVEL